MNKLMEKGNMSKLMGKENMAAKIFFGIFLVAIMVIPELAMAQFDGKFLSITENKTFANTITFGLFCYAGYSWFQFFSSFELASAFMNILKPAIVTFLAFKWKEALTFFFKP